MRLRVLDWVQLQQCCRLCHRSVLTSASRISTLRVSLHVHVTWHRTSPSFFNPPCRLLEVGDRALQAHRDAVTALALGRHGGTQVRQQAQGCCA